MGIKDITGKRYGRLTAVSFTGRQTKVSRNAIWMFKCDCGNYVERPLANMHYSKMPSCGCYVREHAENLNKTHGGRHERLYLVWMDMRRRCYDVKDSNYHNYGGRGIRVCDEWQNYEVFRSWALSSGYDQTAKAHACTLDRIDTNGNYCEENCRWADAKTQCNNRRTNLRIEYQGRTQTLSQWSDELGFSYNFVLNRIKSGWSFERAITEPAHSTRNRFHTGQLV